MGSKSKGINKAMREASIQLHRYRNSTEMRPNPWPMFRAADTVQAFNDRSKARRDKFVSLYNANPCNFLPGHVLKKLYKLDVNQRQLETLAGQAILKINEMRFPSDRINWPVV